MANSILTADSRGLYTVTLFLPAKIVFRSDLKHSHKRPLMGKTENHT